MDFLHIWHKWSLAWEGPMHNDLWHWSLSSRSFSHDFAIKLKYGASCCVRSAAWAVLDGFFPYLAKMIISMRGCVDRSEVKVTLVFIPLVQQSCWGVYWFHSVCPSVCPSVRLSVSQSVHPSRIPCPLCSAYSSRGIHFIFIHLIKQLQKVYLV